MDWSKDEMAKARADRAARQAEKGDRWGRWGRPLADGTYPAEVVEVGVSKDGRKDVLTFRVDATAEAAPEGPVKVNHCLAGPTWAVELTELCPDAYRETEGRLVFDGEAVIGFQCRVVIAHEDWQGERRVKIRRLLPLGKGGEHEEAAAAWAVRKQAQAARPAAPRPPEAEDEGAQGDDDPDADMPF